MSPLVSTKRAADPLWHPLVDGRPPAWASGWGQDVHGVYVEFTVESNEGALVTQRMRWIPSGQFLMGSPETEEGRSDDEGPTHRVTLGKGYWLFHTPCTQELWQAVMGENPSHFVHPRRPVEQVSWRDCQRFLERINASIVGLELALPTEAQWEYACRAGTKTATYEGDLEILGNNNAPILHAIAWYGGNSGVDFDLENGRDSSDWPEKQFSHEKAGTRCVGEKKPNRWGLFDMLGNVWEWCRDGRRNYSPKPVMDPEGSLEEGAERVVRGGGWLDLARYSRSACRGAFSPGFRFDYFGFRCARVQEQE